MNFYLKPDESNVTVTYPSGSGTLDTLKNSKTAVYNFVKAELKNHFVVLPPSGAVAGAYATTDKNRGVWKAPANLSLASVIEPVIKLDNAHQDVLNVDSDTGKSINAIRAFAGKGTLVWGARTLAGNDNEWRYVPVRRFFNMVEESVKKSTYWAVFESNDANTWVKVRGMIENYLTQKWREGALAGATTKDAFFVRCGIGITMTAQDILEGRMIVEIGMAVVRPAEFIILKFSHKLQTS
jgi:phage tail sheath protein FI